MRSVKPSRSSAAGRLGLGLALALIAGCSTNSAIDRSRNYARLGDYQHAFEVVELEYLRQLEAGDVDPEIARVREAMQREFLRDRAQRLIFREQEDAALRDLQRLEELDPENEALPGLRQAALIKKAARIVARADEQLQQKEFAEAMKGYLESQRLVPGFEPAEEGMARVRSELERLSARAQQQFLQAVRKVPEFRHIEVAWHAANVIHSSPDPDDELRGNAETLRRNAQRESARYSMRRAKECEDDNQFGAALVLYRGARQLDPSVEGVDDAIARMEQELKAVGLIEHAQLEMRNQRFAEAKELLDEAFGISLLSRGDISELMIRARELEGEQAYRAARDLEVMGKKSEAVAAFEALAERWPQGVDDEQQRIVALKVDIDGAASEWQAAEQAEAEGKLAEALDHYINAERFYAEWRDGEVHIARLKQLLAERADGQAPESGGS